MTTQSFAAIRTAVERVEVRLREIIDARRAVEAPQRVIRPEGVVGPPPGWEILEPIVEGEEEARLKILTVSNLDITDEEATNETRALECKICLTNKICVALKCGHTFCYSCTTRFKGQCATCRTPFTDETLLRLYI